MKTKYEIGEKFILNKDSSFYMDGELVDISKGSIFYINDIIESSNCINCCYNRKECAECTMYFMVIFDTFETEVRFTEIELDEIISK